MLFISVGLEERLSIRFVCFAFKSLNRGTAFLLCHTATALARLSLDPNLMIHKLLLDVSLVHRRVETTHRTLSPTSHFLPLSKLALA